MRHSGLLQYLVLLLVTISIITRATKDPGEFFRSLDQDADGDVDADELRKAIHEFGGEHFDETHEIEGAVEHAMRLDKDNDRAILHKDLVAQWMTFASMMSPEMVGEWMKHAVGLKDDIALAFVEANFTGLDLPQLVGKHVDTVLHDIKVILSRTDRLKLLGAIKLRMLNVGTAPHTPELKVLDASKTARCGTVLLTWSSATRAFPEIHKYRLFRRISRDDDLPENSWTLIFEGLTTAFNDRIKDETARMFDYKIEAWNVIGPSQAFELHDVQPSTRGCESANWIFTILSFFVDMRMYTVNILGIGTVIFFYLSPHQRANEPHRAISRGRSQHRGSINGVDPALSSVKGSSFFLDSSANANGVLEFGDDQSDSSSVRLPESIIQAQESPGRRQAAISYSTDRCVECQCVVGRTTRHQCGTCLRVFCLNHTAIHPHTEARIPFVGTVVLSSCGINSKCRCYGCAGIPFPSSSPSSGDANSPTNSVHSKNSGPLRKWSLVRKDILTRKTLKIWKRSSETNQNGDGGPHDNTSGDPVT